MTRVKHTALCAVLLGMAAGLAGCPLAPVLFVSPLSMVFHDGGPAVQNFRVSNAGGGVLNWTAGTDAPWLTLSQAATGAKGNSISGSVSTGVAMLQATANVALLPAQGTATAQIVVTSNGGSLTIPVSASRETATGVSVAPTSLDFGTTTETLIFDIVSSGPAAVSWTVSVPETAPWLSLSPATGNIPATGGSRQVTVDVDRSELAFSTYTTAIAVTTNQGNFSIPVTMQVAPFSVEPVRIDFGTLLAPATETIGIQNKSFDPLILDITATSDGGWLSANTNQVQLIDTFGALSEFRVTANPAGLAPGEHAGEIAIASTLLAAPIRVPVTVRVPGITVAPASIDLGLIEDPVTTPVTLSNAGLDPATYQVTVPAADSWLAIQPGDSGSIAGGTPASPAQVTLNFVVTPPAAAGDYATAASIAVGGETLIVPVSFRRPAPAALTIAPDDLDFGTSATIVNIGIWNSGTDFNAGVINWSIDTVASGFPAWLTLEPITGGVAQGSVSGTDTDSLTLRVNRALAPAGQTEFNFTFNVNGTGVFAGAVPVNVHMTNPPVPHIVLEAEGIAPNGVPFLNFAEEETSQSFFVRNTGTGTLTWQIDTTAKPVWITSIEPANGTIARNGSERVTIAIDRRTLSSGPTTETILVLSDDPQAPEAPLSVGVITPPRISIGVIQESGIQFTQTANLGRLDVANFGDDGTQLNYTITDDADWLSIFPETGKSIGTNLEAKDFQIHSVAVDRSQLDGDGAVGTITVSAYKTVGGRQVLDTTIAKVEVEVSVQAASLTIEGNGPRIRIPSLVRSVYMLRNIAYQIIPIPESYLQTVGSQFVLAENTTPLELTETNQFLRNDSRLRTNLLILLDYSGSMRQTAEALIADGQLNGGVPALNPVQTLYEACVPQLIDTLPDHYRVALAVFNERTTDPTEYMRVLRENDDEPLFTRDKNVLLSRFATANDVADNGASQILNAFVTASNVLLEEDVFQDFIPFDDADVRGILAITDGRITTSQFETISSATTALRLAGTRLFCVGFGDAVAAAPLLAITTETGGHLYSTRTESTNTQDEFGQLISKPLLSELIDWCEDTSGVDKCDQSVARDLRSQVVLSYTTLLQESGVGLEETLNFNDPNDQNSECLDEQDEITGSIGFSGVDYLSSAGDVHLGQVSLRTLGVEAGNTAAVTVRCEYMPRNITSLTFEMVGSVPFTVSLVPNSRGGLISDWVQTVAGDRFTFTSPVQSLLDGFAGADADSSGALTLAEAQTAVPSLTEITFAQLDADHNSLLTSLEVSTGNAPLQYGDFGDMIELEFASIPAPPADLFFQVVEPHEDASLPDSKYFVSPNHLVIDLPGNMLIGVDEFRMTAFPRPLLVANPPFARLGDPGFVANDAPTIILDQDENTAVVNIFNAGGSYVQPGALLAAPNNSVGLAWLIDQSSVDATFEVSSPADDTNDPNDVNYIIGNDASIPLSITINRCNATPGNYTQTVNIKYGYGTVTFGELLFATRAIKIKYTVTPPVLPPAILLSSNAFDFPTGINRQTLDITNTGELPLTWEVSSFPPAPGWLDVNLPTGAGIGEVCGNETETLTLAVDRTTFSPPQSFNLILETNVGDFTIAVTLSP